MDINKGKLLVYLLTFAAYAWSGYGSGVLSHLKDAVITAESLFGDFIDKFQDVVGKIKDAREAFDSTIQEDCIFNCPAGGKPKPNKYHRPKSNGCGPEGMTISTESMSHADMTKCCDEHDICYGTCNKDKEKCDLEFKRCLYQICEKDVNNLSESAITACKISAKMLYTGTTTLGCSYFLTAQKEACYCQPVKNKYKDEF